MSINKVIIVGNLGAKPEVFEKNNNTVVKLSVATSESYVDKRTGEKVENTEWHRVTVFGNLAKVAAQYLRTGSKVYIEGALKTSKYQDKDGVDKYATDIILSGYSSVLQMLDAKPSDA